MKFWAIVAGALLFLGAGQVRDASAQTYPDRPINLVVAFAAGGINDTSARILAKGLSDALGVKVVVENKPGAGGIVGTEFAANAKPDGYTILHSSSGPLVTIPHLMKRIPYDPTTSLVPIRVIWEASTVMLARLGTPYQNVTEFIEFAHRNPGKVNYGSTGVGTNSHLSGEMLQQVSGIKLTHVPYNGTPAMINDLLAGAVDVGFEFLAGAKPYLDTSRLRPLAVTSASRLKELPNTPTVKEIGYRDAVLVSWAVIVAPAKTPEAVVSKLKAGLDAAMENPEIIAAFERIGVSLVQSQSIDEVKRYLADENMKFKSLVAASGAKID